MIIPHKTSSSWAITSLIIANLVPLYGAYVYNWNVFSIMLIYWAESAIIGFFTILKMRKVEPLNPTLINMTISGRPAYEFSKKYLSSFFPGFFMLHYGIFMFVHLVFILVFFFSPKVLVSSIAVSLASLFVSHLISYQTNFIQGQEYKKVTQDVLFFSPYPRIIAMHLTIVLGSWFVLASGDERGALVLLVGVKTFVDLLSHLFQHHGFKTPIDLSHG